MPPSTPSPAGDRDLTRAIHAARATGGDAPADGPATPLPPADFAAVVGELRAIAQSLMRGERRNHTLQATALVSEAWLRLSESRREVWEDRRQFFGAAAETMRRILIDHARARNAKKRGGSVPRPALDGAADAAVAPLPMAMEPDTLLALDAALTTLATTDERAAELVRLRFFCGLTLDEAAAVLDVSARTAYRDWQFARAVLADAMPDLAAEAD